MKLYLQILALSILLTGCARYSSVTFDQPGSPWQFHFDPGETGYSAIKLAKVGNYAETLSTDAIVVVLNGQNFVGIWRYHPTQLPCVSA